MLSDPALPLLLRHRSEHSLRVDRVCNAFIRSWFDVVRRWCTLLWDSDPVEQLLVDYGNRMFMDMGLESGQLLSMFSRTGDWTVGSVEPRPIDYVYCWSDPTPLLGLPMD